MAGSRFRIFIENEFASNDFLNKIDEIFVEQEVDLAWECRITMQVKTDKDGNWSPDNEEFMNLFSRVRVEIQNGNNEYIPLIDGSVTGFDESLNSEPGQSSITIKIHDDSILMNRVDKVRKFEKLKDYQIAQQILQESENISSIDVSSNSDGNIIPVLVQRGSDMKTLQSLAKSSNFHAYVIPSSIVGSSTGCFKSFPEELGNLEPLVLLGPNRNISSFDVINDGVKPTKFKASKMNSEKEIITSEASFRDSTTLGSTQVLDSSVDEGTVLLYPWETTYSNVEQRVNSYAKNSSFAIEASGSILDGRYPNVLTPYQMIQVAGVPSSLRGNYIITKVIHEITRDSYSQHFTVTRNSFSDSQSISNNIPGGIF